MKKTKLFYDVTIILLAQNQCYNRTGIYFCAYNILKKLRSHAGIKIFLYTQYQNLIPIAKKIGILKGLKFINIQDDSIYKKNVNSYLNSITNSNNFLLKFINLLKIIKNYLFILKIKYENKKLRNIDAFLAPSNHFPEMINIINVKKFIMLYDVTPILFPDFFPEGMSSSWENCMRNYLDKETYCFCISECTKKDFIKFFGENLDENKMMVTYISSANNFEPKYDQNAIKYISNKYKLNIDRYKYIFSFCALEHRKNLIFTIKCFIKFIQKNNINDLFFFLGGNQWDNFIAHLNETLGELPEDYKSKIIRLGYIDDSDVNILYSNSLFFTFLSMYEGFGMPLLEAMQAGVPIITSNSSSLPEVTGDAAITIDYDDEEACINAMETLYFNEDLRQTYIKKGLKRARLFSWEKTVKIMSNKIIDIVNNTSKLGIRGS
jgi:glycosyltransferase involved in cell wall biosynthesis